MRVELRRMRSALTSALLVAALVADVRIVAYYLVLAAIPAAATAALGYYGELVDGSAEAETGQVVAHTRGSGERGAWSTAQRNAGAPGLAVESTRCSQTWAWLLRLATPHWGVASGGVAAIGVPLRVRGTGRPRAP